VKKFFSVLDALLEQNRVLKFGIAVMALANAVLVFGLLYVVDRQKVVVVPPELRKEFWVAGNRVSRSYLEQVFFFVTDRLLNVSPENVESSVAAVYPFLTTDPEGLKAVQEQLQDYVKRVKKNKVWQVFYPVALHVKENEVIVAGVLKRGIMDQLLETKDKKVRYLFSVRGGRLLIERIDL